MTDELRTRIAAALSAHIERQLTNCDTGREECGCGQQGSSTYGEHVADALIRELGLIKVPMSEWDVLNHGWRGHRYVTEWMADE